MFCGFEMPKLIHTSACAVLLTLFSTVVFSETVIVNLEEPNADGVYTGITNLRGWAVAESGIAVIEVDVDGSYAFDVPMGALEVMWRRSTPIFLMRIRQVSPWHITTKVLLQGLSLIHI